MRIRWHISGPKDAAKALFQLKQESRKAKAVFFSIWLGIFLGIIMMGVSETSRAFTIEIVSTVSCLVLYWWWNKRLSDQYESDCRIYTRDLSQAELMDFNYAVYAELESLYSKTAIGMYD